jgi:hypothetical protein
MFNTLMKNTLQNSLILTCSAFAALVLAGCGIFSSDDFPGPPPGAGDIDLNGVPFEQADFDRFLDYFFFTVPLPQKEFAKGLARTDVNGDGVTGTIEDLVYFENVRRGTEIPPDKLNHSSTKVKLERNAGWYTADKPLGGLLFRVQSYSNSYQDTIISGIHYYARGRRSGKKTTIALPVDDIIPEGTPVYIPGLFISSDASSTEGTTLRNSVSLDYPGIRLLGNVPNPFRFNTKISFFVARPFGHTVTVRNSLGRLVMSTENKSTDMDAYTVEWIPSSLAPGTYFYEVRVGEESATGKVIYQK